MKKILALGALALGLTFSASAQKMASCCARPAGNLSASATEAFAMLATDKDFSGGHDAPLPYEFKGEGKMIEFKTPEGSTGKGFEIKSAKPSNKYLFVIHEWWGLNDYIKKKPPLSLPKCPA